jgi:hypothetical protein
MLIQATSGNRFVQREPSSISFCPVHGLHPRPDNLAPDFLSCEMREAFVFCKVFLSVCNDTLKNEPQNLDGIFYAVVFLSDDERR